MAVIFVGIDEWGVGKSGEHLSTILGSCVSVCLWSKVLSIGAMNHFLLPHSAPGRPVEMSSVLTDTMIHELAQSGYSLQHFQAVIIGGASSPYDFYDVGGRNVEAAAHSLNLHQIPFQKICIGESWSRKIDFDVRKGIIEIHKVKELKISGAKMTQVKRFSFERGLF